MEPRTVKREDLHMRDPFIYCDRERGLYLLFGTTLADGAGDVDPCFQVFRSADLETFTGPETAFAPPVGFWGVRHYWAPEVHKYKGRYYMLATFKGGIGADRGTTALVSERPEGPYIPHSRGALTPAGQECLDGTLALDPDGSPWLVYCNEWTRRYHGTIEALPLKSDLTEALPQPPAVIVDTRHIPWIRLFCDPRIAKQGYLTDAPFVHRMKDGGLLLLWSSYTNPELGYSGGYCVAMARSDSGLVRGPWRQLPDLLLDANCGHSSLFYDLKGGLRLCAHRPDTPHGMERPCFYSLRETAQGLEVLTQ